MSALETARRWREKLGYTGPWVLFSAQERRDRRDVPYSYQSLWIALRKAEDRSGVRHQAYRALHGFRLMVAGNVLDATRHPKLALEWVGDRDLKQMKSYLLRREDRLRLAAEAVATT